MSYDLLIERADGEPFAHAEVEAAVAKFPQLRRYDAESYRSASTELILAAERPGGPVDNMTLQLRYSELPGSFDGACDTALGLAEALGGRVVDSQLGETVTAENRDESRAKAAEVARWSKRLGSEFEAPPKRYVDMPAERAPSGGDSGRPWWKFWARD
jgi:hypothetical protein